MFWKSLTLFSQTWTGILCCTFKGEQWNSSYVATLATKLISSEILTLRLCLKQCRTGDGKWKLHLKKTKRRATNIKIVPINLAWVICSTQSLNVVFSNTKHFLSQTMERYKWEKHSEKTERKMKNRSGKWGDHRSMSEIKEGKKCTWKRLLTSKKESLMSF